MVTGEKGGKWMGYQGAGLGIYSMAGKQLYLFYNKASLHRKSLSKSKLLRSSFFVDIIFMTYLIGRKSRTRTFLLSRHTYTRRLHTRR